MACERGIGGGEAALVEHTARKGGVGFERAAESGGLAADFGAGLRGTPQAVAGRGGKAADDEAAARAAGGLAVDVGFGALEVFVMFSHREGLEVGLMFRQDTA